MGQLKTNRSAEKGRAQRGTHAPSAKVGLAFHWPSTAIACATDMPGEIGAPLMRYGDDEAVNVESVDCTFIFGYCFQKVDGNHAVGFGPQSNREDPFAVMLASDMREVQKSPSDLHIGLADVMNSSLIEKRVRALEAAAFSEKRTDPLGLQWNSVRSRRTGKLVALLKIDGERDATW